MIRLFMYAHGLNKVRSQRVSNALKNCRAKGLVPVAFTTTRALQRLYNVVLMDQGIDTNLEQSLMHFRELISHSEPYYHPSACAEEVSRAAMEQ